MENTENMKNWKTTTLGILTIIGALSAAAKQALESGHFDFGAALPQITAGWALIHAADASPSGGAGGTALKSGAIAAAIVAACLGIIVGVSGCVGAVTAPGSSSAASGVSAVASAVSSLFGKAVSAVQWDASKASAWANSNEGSLVLGGIDDALMAVGAMDPDAAVALNVFAQGIADLKSATLPSASEIESAIVAAGASQATAAEVAPKVSAALQAVSAAKSVRPSAAVAAVAEHISTVTKAAAAAASTK